MDLIWTSNRNTIGYTVIQLFNAQIEEKLDMLEAKTKNIGIIEAIREVRDMGLGRTFRALHDARMKEIRDRNARDDYMRVEGLAEGEDRMNRLILDLIQAGRQKDIEKPARDKEIQQLRKQNITPLIGAGLSSWAYPLWGQMLSEQANSYGIKTEVDVLLNKKEYEEAASLLKEKLTANGLINMLQQIFHPEKLKEKAASCPAYLKTFRNYFMVPLSLLILIR